MELKQVSDDLHKLVKDFQEENDKRLEAIEKKGTDEALQVEKIDKMNTTISDLVERIEAIQKETKQAGGAKESEKKEEPTLAQKAWQKLLHAGVLSGDEEGALAEFAPAEQKATLLATGVAAQGGNWAPNEFVRDLLRDVAEISAMRPLCRIHTTSFGNAEFPTHTGAGAAVRVAETGQTRDAATTPTAGLVTIPVSELMARYDATRKMVNDAAFNIEEIIREDMAEQIAIKEGNDFIKGSGSAPNPQGFLANVGSTVAITATITADNVISLYYALKTPYAMNGTFLARRATIEAIRILKDGNNQYIWSTAVPGGITTASPQSLMGRPLVEAPDIDAVGSDTSGNRPLAFGDFRRGYVIVDQVAFRLLVDPYSDATNGVTRFYGYVYNGGAVVKAEALAAVVQ
jgi:HK97 family phage major capsid protein